MRCFALLMLLVGVMAEDIASPWPPVLEQTYPDLALQTLDGKPVNLRRFAGKPLLIELVGMPCAGCQAMLGGHRPGVGGYGGVAPQASIGALNAYLKRDARGLQVGDSSFTMVVILLYGMDMQAPSLEDARAFAQHFRLGEREQVLVGDQRYIRDDVRSAIPGFHLVDREFRFRSDAGGGSAPHPYWSHTFPLLARLAGR